MTGNFWGFTHVCDRLGGVLCLEDGILQFGKCVSRSWVITIPSEQVHITPYYTKKRGIFTWLYYNIVNKILYED